MLSSRSLAGQAIALVGVIALFVIIGPFGTYDSLTRLERLGYWGITMSANWLVCGSVMMLSLLDVRIRSRRHYLTIVGTALVAAVPGTGVVYTADWVARDHVVETMRENGRTILCLTAGHKVPVSRSYLADARTAGLL